MAKSDKPFTHLSALKIVFAAVVVAGATAALAVSISSRKGFEMLPQTMWGIDLN